MKGFLHQSGDPGARVEDEQSCPNPKRPGPLQHPGLRQFYPTGEGGGYAGGILSAAMDGRKVARAVALSLGQFKD